MPYGLVSTASLQTSDMVAPGLPIFIALNQESNQIIKATIAMPTTDANGDNLTGLTKLTVATLAQVGGDNPFDGLSMAEILALQGVQVQNITLKDEDAGTEKQVDMPIVNLGGMQAFAAACADD